MDPQDDSFDFLFKIILIGDSNVGKTCLVQSFSTGRFSERQQNTIGVDFTVRTLRIEGRRVKVRGHAAARIRDVSQLSVFVCVYAGQCDPAVTLSRSASTTGRAGLSSQCVC